MPRRWTLVAITALVVAAVVTPILLRHPGDPGLHRAIRLTARISLVLFLSAFVASSVNALWHGPVGKWLLANRRWLGLSFATSHLTHAGLIIALAATSPTYSLTDGLAGTIGGGVAYLFVLAMVVTSFDGPTRALGRRRWKLLHSTGVHVLWSVFALTYVSSATRSPLRAVAAALVVGALALRVVARLRARPVTSV